MKLFFGIILLLELGLAVFGQAPTDINGQIRGVGGLPLTVEESRWVRMPANVARKPDGWRVPGKSDSVAPCSVGQLVGALKVARELIPDRTMELTGTIGWSYLQPPVLIFPPPADSPASLRRRADELERVEQLEQAENERRRKQVTLVEEAIKACDHSAYSGPILMNVRETPSTFGLFEGTIPVDVFVGDTKTYTPDRFGFLPPIDIRTLNVPSKPARKRVKHAHAQQRRQLRLSGPSPTTEEILHGRVWLPDVDDYLFIDHRGQITCDNCVGRRDGAVIGRIQKSVLKAMYALDAKDEDEPERAHAQQPTIVPPTTYTLNAEASASYVELEKIKQDLIRQLNVADARQKDLMTGAGIPASERDRQPALGKDGIISFAPKPLKTETPKVN